MGNCDVWGRVDFGQGMVWIRCTKIGEHTDHACEVGIEAPPVMTAEQDTPAGHSNVFEGDNG